MIKLKEFIRKGDIFIWFTGFGLGLTILMISGLLYLILVNGSDYYYPQEITHFKTTSGDEFLGQIKIEENIPKQNLPDSLKEKNLKRFKMKIANRDIYGLDFRWFDASEIDTLYYPKNAAILERREFGNFHGYLKAIKQNGNLLFNSKLEIDANISDLMDKTDETIEEIEDIEKSKIGSINYKIEKKRLNIKRLKYKSIENNKAEITELNDEIAKLENEYHNIVIKLDSLRNKSNEYTFVVRTANGQEKDISLAKVVRIYYPNEMGIFDKSIFIIKKINEFLFEDPRESNTEGGVFPAIFGTVMMVILMSLFAVPFGVITALYLREYAKQGFMVRMVRIAVNNLAGVPSIVFGVFGLGFFIYFVGGTIDQLFYSETLPTPTWGTGGILWASLTLALLTVPVVIVSTEEALASIPRGIREAALALGSTKWQMIRKVVLPAAMPGILTGIILAMARGAGEVAPLMITGVVKLAPNLPLDGMFPFFHLDRKFMHLGFHIYDVGFQSPNVEAALPMVYMTTILLIFIVVVLNISAMIIRNKLREKYKSATF